MSVFIQSLERYIPFRKKRPQLSREQALAVRPFVNPVLTWDRNEKGEVVIQIPVRDDRVGKILGRLFGNVKGKQLVLDEVGSSVWVLCDGEHSVGCIVGEMCRAYKLNKREAETSVTMYLKMLAERNLVGLKASGSSKRATAARRKSR